ncbi:sucrose-6-phosphate hydrolase [Priestia filamentosa]|uniref:glycoside hydrolase family 32 protein n=1 Tax=Priestia filamentosa TaxID=1402861 RepID=UPI003983C86F
MKKMTREEKYRHIEQAPPGELERLREKVSKSPWRQKYHIQPQSGLLNDPNGFSYYNGAYHLFYQWFPFGPEHGMKYWFHTISKDLAHWEEVGIAIKPGGPYDSHGAYSGSGIVKDNKLYLMYTGNTRDHSWVRHPFQCMAEMDQHHSITKFNQPVISHVPSGYTDHFRDPKVWKSNEDYFCVIGAQRDNKTGCVVLYQSKDLLQWVFKGEILTDLNKFGYMWECPDYFEMDEHGILLFSPQGIEQEKEKYNNIYQSGYLVGKPLDVTSRIFEHQPFKELDKGFDFYAQQTTETPDGRRILVGWMGLPDLEYPTDKEGWAHCLTLPRQISIKDEKLIQRPVSELTLLRKKEKNININVHNETKKLGDFHGTAYELICDIEDIKAERVGVEFRASNNEKTVLSYDFINRELVLDRSLSGLPLGNKNGNIRRCSFNAQTLKIHMFVDVSSVEIFINDGEEVFTSRIFPNESSQAIRFFAQKGSATFKAVKWDY